MKLSRRIIMLTTMALLGLFGMWALVFYQTSKSRIYGRIDRVLTQQSDKIISRFLENDSLPNSLSGLSGTVEFFIEKVTPEYALSHQEVVFATDEHFVDDIQDEESFREMTRTFKKQGIDYELTLLTPVFAWNDTLDFAVVSILSLALALLVAIILIVSFIVIRNMRPLYRLTDWLQNRKEGEDIPQPDSSIKIQEFKEIETAVLEASEKSKRVFEEQKRFIGNASHEIQTPLAVCRNRLELLVDNTQLDENQLSEIEKTLDTLNYISRLNRSLLLLSKIENQQFNETADVNLNRIVDETLTNLGEIYESMNISCFVEEKQTLVATMDPTLASSLVSNLLKNAFVHNRQGGNIRVELAGNALRIGNSGPAEPLDGEAVFQTFYKKGENPQSSGLGLAIVKAICNRYGFVINYQFIGNQHVFSVLTK